MHNLKNPRPIARILEKYLPNLALGYPVSDRNWEICLTEPTAAGMRTRRKACLFHADAVIRLDWAPARATYLHPF